MPPGKPTKAINLFEYFHPKLCLWDSIQHQHTEVEIRHQSVEGKSFSSSPEATVGCQDSGSTSLPFCLALRIISVWDTYSAHLRHIYLQWSLLLLRDCFYVRKKTLRVLWKINDLPKLEEWIIVKITSLIFQCGKITGIISLERNNFVIWKNQPLFSNPWMAASNIRTLPNQFSPFRFNTAPFISAGTKDQLNLKS